MVFFDILLTLGLALLVGIFIGLIFAGFYSQYVNMKAMRLFRRMKIEQEKKAAEKQQNLVVSESRQKKFSILKPWTWFRNKNKDKGGLNNGKEEIKRAINGRIDEGERESAKPDAIGSSKGKQEFQIPSHKKSSRHQRQFKQDWPSFS